MKSKVALVTAIPLTWFVDALKYIYNDWEFAKWVCILVVLDTVLGIVKSIIHREVSSDEFGNKFGKKMLGYISLMILSNVLYAVTVHGSAVGITQWLSGYLCVFMLIRETISILENVNAIIPIVPASLIKYLKEFNDKGQYFSKAKKEAQKQESEQESEQEQG